MSRGGGCGLPGESVGVVGAETCVCMVSCVTWSGGRDVWKAGRVVECWLEKFRHTKSRKVS